MIQLESHFRKHGFWTNGVYRHERRSSFGKDRSILKKKKILQKTMLQVLRTFSTIFRRIFFFFKIERSFPKEDLRSKKINKKANAIFENVINIFENTFSINNMLLHEMINILKLLFEIFNLYMFILKKSHCHITGRPSEPPFSLFTIVISRR